MVEEEQRGDESLASVCLPLLSTAALVVGQGSRSSFSRCV